jgi:hypothetical protein
MSNYFHNLRLWITGFGLLGTIGYKPGWNPHNTELTEGV